MTNLKKHSAKKKVKKMNKNDNINNLILLAINFIGRVYGRTFIQKLFFLIENELLTDLDLNYIKYHYGPFSRDLRDSLNILVEQNLVSVSINMSNGNIGYCYQLTPKGEEALKNIKTSMDEKTFKKLQDFCSEYKRYSPSELLRLVYSKYPEWTVNSVMN